MRSLVLAAALALLCACPLPARAADPAAPPDAILGEWVTEPGSDGLARVLIRRDGDTLSGHVSWLENPRFPASEGPSLAGRPKTDRRNPDPQRRGAPILGLVVLSGFRPSGPGVWAGGTVYDPESGNTYRGTLRLESDGTLRVRGYVGWSLFGRTAVWARPGSAGPRP